MEGLLRPQGAVPVGGGVVHVPEIRAVPDDGDRVDGARADDPADDAPLRGERDALPHRSVVHRRLQDDAVPRGRVGPGRLQGVEQRVAGQLLREYPAEAAPLGQPATARRRVAGLGEVVVARRGEADLVPMAQVRLAEPLEGAVLGHDLDERLQLRIAQAVVAGLVRVGDHHHVRRIVHFAQPRVQVRQCREVLGRDALAVLRRAEEDVVVSAEQVPRSPLVAEIGDEAAFLGVGGDVALHHLPLEIVGPDVVLRVGHEIESGVLLGPGHEAVRGADPFGEARVAVGVAPVDGEASGETSTGFATPVMLPSAEAMVMR